MGWQHAIAGGQGNLVATSLQSPDFQHLVQGWQVARDGSAEFNNLTIRGTFFGTDFIINAAGIFFYSGTPAPGNLLLSIASAAGADSFGNAYPAGLSITGGTQALMSLYTSGVNFTTPYQAPLSGTMSTLLGIDTVGLSSKVLAVVGAAASASPGSPALIGFDPQSGKIVVGTGAVLVAQDPGGGKWTAETWHDMAPGLLSGWTVTTGQDARYQLMPDNSVWLDADLTAGTLAGGTNVWTAPSGYVPGTAVARRVPATLVASTAAAQATDPYFTMGAHLQVHNMVTGQTRVIINARYPLS